MLDPALQCRACKAFPRSFSSGRGEGRVTCKRATETPQRGVSERVTEDTSAGTPACFIVKVGAVAGLRDPSSQRPEGAAERGWGTGLASVPHLSLSPC